MKKSLQKFAFIMCIIMSLFLVAGLSACNLTNSDNGNSGNQSSDVVKPELSIETVYAYAQDAGYTGTLEDLIAAFKGNTGDKGDKGNDGVSITDVTINADNELIVTLSNDQTINAGKITTTQSSADDDSFFGLLSLG